MFAHEPAACQACFHAEKEATAARTIAPDQALVAGLLSVTFDACRKSRILAMKDGCCREKLCSVPDTSISGARVAREVDAVMRIHGQPILHRLAIMEPASLASVS